MKNHTLADIDYTLPKSAIAQSAVEPRDAARLLVIDREREPSDHRVSDLPRLLAPGDLLVVNETKVINARVMASRTSGGRVELLFLRPIDPRDPALWWEVLARPSRRLRQGELLGVEPRVRPATRDMRGEEQVEMGSLIGAGRWQARFALTATNEGLKRFGLVPLPPYFEGELDADDRYQTVFARRAASAAAPTAGLHFTPGLCEGLAERGVAIVRVDLEIGVDTFRPITKPNPLDHDIHSEAFTVPVETADAVTAVRHAGGRVIAVGTTSLRAIESATRADGSLAAGGGVAAGLIAPGYNFSVDGLMTNFHAPRTSLVLMLSAFLPEWREVYLRALRRGYRFLSFGDAMLVLVRSPSVRP